jgi:hypothetical protein
MTRAANSVRLVLGLALGLGAETVASRSAIANEAVNLVPHRAVYDLKLARSGGGQRAVAAVRGRILYDFSGSVCEGYGLNFRQVSEIDSGEGKVALSDLRATSWEEGAAKVLRFSSQNFLNQNLVTEVDGQAERNAGAIAVSITKPEDKKFDLPSDLVFPTDHMRRVIIAARAGKTILEFPVYDGSETGEKVFNTLTVIGQPIKPDEKKPNDASAGLAPLAGMLRWQVTISYFERTGKDGEQTPIYSITFELFDNGISRALSLDYGDFVIAGELTQLDLKDAKPCP